MAVALSQPGQGVQWVSVSPGFRVEHRVELGPGHGAVLAATEALSFVAWLAPGGRALIVARLEGVQGKIAARRLIPLPEKLTRSAGAPACELLLGKDRLFLAVDGPATARLLSLSLDLKTLVHGDSPGPRGVLFEEQGPTLAIPRASAVELFSLDAGLALPGQPRSLPWRSETSLGVAFDTRKGLALSSGQVFEASGLERRALLPPFADIRRVFWAHGWLVLLATDDKGNGAHLLWAD
jgi:hypothetical protein